MNFLMSILFLTGVSNAEDLSHLRVAKWYSMVPNIVICNGADIDPIALDIAIKAWKDRGEKVGKVIKKSCEEKPGKGEIGIYLQDDLPGNAYGIAYRAYHYPNESPHENDIWRARILIDPDHTSSHILLEHELGHAFGFKDTDDRDSIMSVRGSIY